jgi:hypothetical protein
MLLAKNGVKLHAPNHARVPVCPLSNHNCPRPTPEHLPTHSPSTKHPPTPPPRPPQVVKVLNLEEGGAFTVSSADNILEALG